MCEITVGIFQFFERFPAEKAAGVHFADEHPSYDRLNTAYEHGFAKHGVREFVNRQAHTNGLEGVGAISKRGYDGLYHHWGKEHPHRYISESTFRLHEGKVRRHIYGRLDSLCDRLIGRRITYAELVAER